MDKRKKLLMIAGIAALAVTVALLAVLLRNVGAGASADKPITLASGLDFSHWFGPEKKLSKQAPGTYYFKLTGDVSLSAEGVIGSGHRVVLDLDGHTVTGGQTRAFALSEGGALTLKGGTVETAGANADGGVIHVSGASCALTLEDVILSNTDDSHIPGQLTGGVIYANSPTNAEAAVVTLRGSTVINGSGSGLRRAGGAVTLAGSSVMYLWDGTVQNGKAGTSGNIHLEGQAALYMLGGTIRDGAAVDTSEITGFGGNINLHGLSQMQLYGGTVTGGVADRSGGNIFVSNTANVNGASGLSMYGGTVENGSAFVEGGNIYATEKNSVVRIHGGTVQNGDAMRGGNLFLQSTVLEMRGGTLTGKTDSENLISGGNIYAAQSSISLYDGRIEKGTTQKSGGNIYAVDAAIEIYGGTVTGGATATTEVTQGGGNLYAGSASTVNMYGGEISDGVSSYQNAEEESAAGGNVMIAGTTRMQMYGGTIKNGMVYGKITRGGSVYVYGQVKGNDTVFHMYGGTIENGLMSNTMRGLCIGSYSETKGDSGSAVARIFGGEIVYTGPADSPDKVYAIYGNKSDNEDLYLYDAEKYTGMYKKITAGPCEDPSHGVVTEQVAATCLTHGYSVHSCAACGTWHEITAEPTGHSEQTREVAGTAAEPGYTEHTCAACQARWITDITDPQPTPED